MKKRMEKVSKEKGKEVEEEPSHTAEWAELNPSKCDGLLNIQDKCPVQSIDDYQCSGNLEVDFPELCALVGLREIPEVRPLTAAPPSSKRAMENIQDQIFSESCMTIWSPKPRLHIELENEDSLSVKRVRISGWRVDEAMARVLSKTLPSLGNLQSLEMWQIGLTDTILTSMKNIISMCSKLRTVVLEGTPIPENSYHILLGEDSMITHLSLRNNCIGEDGARLISLALSKTLQSLNMAFNSVGDAGAVYLAQGLRLNRTLLYLSLANNHIGDVGASHLAQVIGPFALTHEEIVERRRQLKRKDQLLISEDSECESALSIPSSSSLECNIKSATKRKDGTKKEEKLPTNQTVTTTGKKEDPKVAKKRTSDTKIPQGRGGKSDEKDKHPSVKEQETEEVVETQSPLLNPAIQSTGGKVIYPGNTTLLSLNLSGNKLTQQSLQMFLSSVACQGKRGLQYISLNRNSFPPDCEVFLKLQEIMSLRNPVNRTTSAQAEAEQGQAA
ncbi:leucine-rich repeat-containing protein 71 isoform X1 [Ictalurus punctatus]|uniref:Leucine-rich repeat-containing protein 71 isoform X1 n=1 Tax=Ictalurus punctatus TaxID=7998 RepID=A0A9F7RC15_ICTPU|nr:leucine-rich repeat-containing protein 71 isoform X1 [Ictalurus punctatus]